jgi:predicted ArsR family transcriptional regulator
VGAQQLSHWKGDEQGPIALLASPVRRAIMEMLELDAREPSDEPVNAGGRTAAQLGEALGLHVTTVRFHLDQLTSAGLVRTHFTNAFGVGRPRKVYAVARNDQGQRQTDNSAPYLQLLAELLTSSYQSPLTPSELGARWIRENVRLERTAPATTPGGWLTKLGRIVQVLEAWGYRPDVTTTEGGRVCRIDLADCPFVDLARANPDVVCGIHHGLLAGALEQLGEDQSEVDLHPFSGPALCYALVNSHQSFRHDQFDLHHTEESPHGR